MKRSSPVVRHAVSILNYFADHPNRALTLTDLIQALKLSRTSCQAWLTELVESGYLYRTQPKTYVMGPKLVAIGRAATEQLSPVHLAQPEMRGLTDDFGAICSAILREGDECIVSSRVVAMSHVGRSSPQGARMLLRAPFAATYYAWSSESEAHADAWLAVAMPTPTPSQRRAMFEAMAFAREHGFCFYIRNPRISECHAAPESVFSSSRTEFPVAMPSDIKPRAEYQLISIVAPVFDFDRQVALVLCLTGFTRTATGIHIEKMGRCLREACDRITATVMQRSLASL
jgi:DNA-binding IclR family transcriptional regulator